MHCTPLDASFGARHHLDLANRLDETERAQLREWFAEHGLLVARKDPVSDA